MRSSLSRVYVVGAGKMGTAIARAWLDNGLSSDALTLVDPAPHAEVQKFAADKKIALSAKVPAAAPEILLMAVKPQISNAVMAEIKSHLTDESMVISIMAGVSLAQMEDKLGSRNIVRCMPNTPAQLGKGVSGLVRGAGVSDRGWALAQELLGAAGKVVALPDESLIDALTALSGSGPAYAFLLVEAMAKAGQSVGLSAEDSAMLARQTVIGAAALLEADPAEASVLRENVTSKGGVTAAALEQLMGADGFESLMIKALRAGRDRSIELGE